MWGTFGSITTPARRKIETPTEKTVRERRERKEASELKRQEKEAEAENLRLER
jgi:hypothetical protein